MMDIKGTGPITGSQIMAEIGDVRRLTHEDTLVAFAGFDSPPPVSVRCIRLEEQACLKARIATLACCSVPSLLRYITAQRLGQRRVCIHGLEAR